MSLLKDRVKDKTVTFVYYREGELWYKTEDGFQFPVPINDVGTAYMKDKDKAILFMRWIRKHMDMLEDTREEQQVQAA